MKTHLFLVLFLFSIIASGVSQDAEIAFPKNAIHLEFGGHGFVYSLKYERLAHQQKRLRTSFIVGMSFYPSQTGIRDFWFPLMLNQQFNIVGGHHLELGAGGIFTREAFRDLRLEAIEWTWGFLGPLRFGYRYQKPNSSIVFRAGFTPVLQALKPRIKKQLSHDQIGFIPFAGISFGYAF